MIPAMIPAMIRRPTSSRGFVLVNALVLVAALAAVVVVLLQHSEGLRLRLMATQQAAQIEQYLDAFDALALHLLAGDVGGGADHLGESWALELPPVTLDRGEVTGEIHDLQGRFNLNWLANPEDTAASAAFDVLLTRLGLPVTQGDAIRAFLRPGGPQDKSAYAALEPAINPVGGAVLMPAQLRQMPGIRPAHYVRLARHVAALPGDTLLNVNTATPEVLAAMLPAARPALAGFLVQERQHTPFISREDIGERLLARFGELALDGVDLERFQAGSSWFGLTSSARFGSETAANGAPDSATARASRQAVIRRLGPPVGPQLVWHLDFRE